MDKVQDAIENLTLQLAVARFNSASSNGDLRLMGLAVAWACRELEGWRLDTFFEATELGAFNAKAVELRMVGERCAELRCCADTGARRPPSR